MVTDIQALATEVAGYLPGWVRAPFNDQLAALLQSPAGAQLTMRLGGMGKLIVGGHLSHHLQVHMPYGRELPRITVSVSRGAKAIAAEIVRRALPILDTLMQEATANANDVCARHDLAMRLATRLINVSSPRGINQPRLCNRQGVDANAIAIPLHLNMIGSCYGSVRVSAYEGGTADFDLRGVPAEQAAKIVEILATVEGPSING